LNTDVKYVPERYVPERHWSRANLSVNPTGNAKPVSSFITSLPPFLDTLAPLVALAA
jgi:hypothetical protein